MRRLEAAARNSGGEGRTESGMKLLWARDSAELGQVASGSAARLLAGRQKSGISDNRRRAKTTLWEKRKK